MLTSQQKSEINENILKSIEQIKSGSSKISIVLHGTTITTYRVGKVIRLDIKDCEGDK